MRITLLLTLLALAFSSCQPDPNYPPEPVITFKDISSSYVVPGVDSLVVSFEFQDGDGDLGAKAGESTINAFLIDQRTGFPYNYQIPYIPEGGRIKDIRGTVWVTVDANAINCRPDHLNLDTLSYEIYIVDRADNESNRIYTPPIILDCK